MDTTLVELLKAWKDGSPFLRAAIVLGLVLLVSGFGGVFLTTLVPGLIEERAVIRTLFTIFAGAGVVVIFFVQAID